MITYLRFKSIVRRWSLLFSIFMPIVGYHLEKTMRLLRRSTNRSIFLLYHMSGNADEPGRVPSIETNGSRKEQPREYGGWEKTSHFSVSK